MLNFSKTSKINLEVHLVTIWESILKNTLVIDSDLLKKPHDYRI